MLLTPPQRAELAALYVDKQMTARALAAHYYVSRETVLRWLALLDIPRRAPVRQRRVDRDAVYALRQRGMSQRAIAAALTCTQATVWHILREEGAA